MEIIAHIRTDFPEKFGIPRQSGLIDTIGKIVFEPKYRVQDALRGIEEYDYLWLLWKFEGTDRKEWSPTVRPPRLGGNTRVGVFATRSPFRPNPIGLSSVRLLRTEETEEGTVLIVSGADLRDRTPIYDIKPYLPFTDSHPDVRAGFSDLVRAEHLDVFCESTLLEQLPEDRRDALLEVLREDPRPGYQDEPDRIYGFPFAGYEVRFRVTDNQLTVIEITPTK